eukprot:Partr_v1_DN27734_c2_g1_i2_m67457 putative meiotic nuclear divisions 1 homolog (S. cerevisiae)
MILFVSILLGHSRIAYNADREIFSNSKTSKRSVPSKRESVGLLIFSVRLPHGNTVAQSVKEVLDSLVNDYLVTAEKIGTSNYFWSFPSTALVQVCLYFLLRVILKAEVENAQSQIGNLETSIAEAKIGREVSDERDQLLATLKETQQLLAHQTQELQKYANNDPEVVDAKKEKLLALKRDINIWIENIMSLQSHCRDRFNMTAADFCAQLDVAEDLDTIT